MRTILIAFLMVGLAAPSQATNSKPELAKVLDDLMAWLPGEYTSIPQVFLERALGAPPDGEHETYYRVFAEIDAPQLAEHVIYTQTQLDGDDGTILPGQQQVFLISIDEEKRTVAVEGRRIKDPETYVDAHLHPETWATIAPDPDFGGNCAFNWRRHGNQLRGLLGDHGQCTMTSKRSGQEMTWDAEWILNPGELWIYDNGTLADGTLFAGREDRTHLRMYKAQRHECFISFRFPDGTAQVVNPFFMHDRGDTFTIVTEEDEPRTLHVEFLNSLWPSNSGRNYVDLMRLTVHDAEPGDFEDEDVIGFAWAAPGSDRVGFTAEGLSARCKKAKPDDPRFQAATLADSERQREQ